MMPTVERLRKRPDFLKVAAARSKWVTPGLILQARRRAAGDRAAGRPAGGEAAGEGEVVRVGFTVSRKVGNAVRRNRARRRLRAAAADVLPRDGRAGFDYVLVGRGGTLDRPYAALVDDLRTALRHLTGDGRGPRRRGGPRRTEEGGG